MGFYEKLAVIMRKHWSETPWNNNPKWNNYKSTEIMIQSKLEKSFVESLEEKYGIEWIKNNVRRGPCFYYIDPASKTTRLYISDFVINNVIYEVKGSYTWNRHGQDILLEQRNRAKLNAVKEKGFKVILVLDGEHIIYGN